jgi:NitT/TauT family transport system substrate-binding protein
LDKPSFSRIQIFDAATMMKLSRWITVAAICLTLPACTRKPDAPRKLDVVKVARSAFLSNAPILLGDREGYFRQEGIQLAYIDQPNNSVQTLPGLDRGDVDVVASVVSIGLINAISGGASVKIVADRGIIDPNACESFGIVGRRSLFGDKPVTAEMLRGLKVATNPLGQSGYLTDLFLRKYGLTLKDVDIVRIPANAEGAAMDGGSLDITARSDPFLFGLLRRGHRLLAGARELSPGTHLSVLVYGPSLVVRDRDLGLRFMRAYLRSVRQYSEGHTPRNVAIVSTALGLDSADVSRMCWPATRKDGSINFASLSDYAKWAQTTGQFRKPVPPKNLVDMDFATKAWATVKNERASQ